MRLIFFLFSTTIFGLIYFYIGSRLITPAPFKKCHKRLLWIGLFILPLLLPLSFTLRFLVNNSFFIDLIAWIAYISMGLSSLLLVFLLFRDIYSVFSKIFRKIFGKRILSIKEKLEYNPERRKLLINAVNMTALGASALLTGYGIYEARRRAHLENVTVPIKNLPPEFEGFRIAQFSDVHTGPTIKRAFVESVVEQVNSLNPHIIACTGDMVDGSVTDLRDDVAPLRDLHAPFGKFFVTGNHEYYVNALPWIDEFNRLGMNVLLNENQIIKKGSSQILIAGVTDYTSEQFVKDHKSDPFYAVKNEQNDLVKILLAHQPKSIFTASEAGYDLQISGHTHGGQYIPWSFLVTITQPYVAGLNKHKNTWIYVNRGTGYWGPPMRIGIPSEVTLFTLTSRHVEQNSDKSRQILS
jgi:predicted MPP superfamily phosphohydrolase